jgi:hypothetical protein
MNIKNIEVMLDELEVDYLIDDYLSYLYRRAELESIWQSATLKEY